MRRSPTRRRADGARAAPSPTPTRSRAVAALVARGRAPGRHGRRRRLLGPSRGRRCAAGPRLPACRCSPTAWAAARCRPTTSSRSHGPLGARSRRPTSSSWRARRSTSGWASASSATRASCTSATRRTASRGHAPLAAVDRGRPRPHVRRARRRACTGGRARRRGSTRLRGRGTVAPGDRRRGDWPRRRRRSSRSAIYGELRAPARPRRDRHRRRRRLRLLRRASSSTATSRAASSIPGPFGCLGTGPGYALAAGVAHPGRQVVLLLGDGAIGFSLGDLDTLVRLRHRRRR